METKTSCIDPTTSNKKHMRQHIGNEIHHKTVNKRNITGKHMLENVTVLARSNNRTDLAKLETLLIKQHNPVINKQVKDFSRTLKTF